MKQKVISEKKVYEQARMEPVLLSSRASLLAESSTDPSSSTVSSLSGTLGRVNYTVITDNPFQN